MSETFEQIDKSELLVRIRAERERLEETLARLSEEQMVEPGVVDDWSVKDILAHLVTWEQRMVRWMDQALRGEVPDRPGSDEEIGRWNQQSYADNRDRPLAEVLTDFRESYPRALRAAETAPEDDLVDPDRFAWRNGLPLWVMVAANTSWHYREHGESIRAWLDRIGAS